MCKIIVYEKFFFSEKLKKYINNKSEYKFVQQSKCHRIINNNISFFFIHLYTFYLRINFYVCSLKRFLTFFKLF